jgi:FKBP-type peptidyl-prolyl cis-trans isomerase
VRASRFVSPAAAIALALLAAACGSSSSSVDSAIQQAPSDAQTSTAPTATVPTTPANPALAKKPTIARQTGPAPKQLVVRDLVTGTGPAAKAGQTISVQYVGVLYKTGKQFDASWDRGQPFTFALGTGMVIKGWDQGVVGMHVGGRRQLVVPAALAYKAVARPGIPPNSTLVFDVDLLSAQ